MNMGEVYRETSDYVNKVMLIGFTAQKIFMEQSVKLKTNFQRLYFMGIEKSNILTFPQN
jgi:hypothetical protein